MLGLSQITELPPTFVVQVPRRSKEGKFQARKDRKSSGGRKPACNLTWEPTLGSHGFSTCDLLILVQPPEHWLVRAIGSGRQLLCHSLTRTVTAHSD